MLAGVECPIRAVSRRSVAMTSPVAREGDVSTTVGTTPFTGATSGTWTAGDLELTTTGRAQADGKEIVTAASCTFSFAGTNGQTNVNGTSVVTLQPASRRLRFGTASPLVHGNSASDTFGNTIRVTSSATWATA